MRGRFSSRNLPKRIRISQSPKTSGEAIAGNACCFFRRQIGDIEGMLGLIDISQFTAPPAPKA
jgi:hypothetical protein